MALDVVFRNPITACFGDISPIYIACSCQIGTRRSLIQILEFHKKVSDYKSKLYELFRVRPLGPYNEVAVTVKRFRVTKDTS